MGLWNRLSTNWIHATPAILVTGYVAQYAAFGTRTILAGFARTPADLEEALLPTQGGPQAGEKCGLTAILFT